MSVVDKIEEIVHRESQAWDEGDVELLLSICHPDLVWVWPPSGFAGDLLAAKLQVSRFDPERWRAGWGGVLANELLRNDRKIRKVTVAPDGDSAVAIVDVETAWRTPEGSAGWSGRSTKCFVRVGGDWKMIAHIGL
ncbi:MAG: DUF4440 domain-containing protein [Acidobacteria bacterium]|nr:DUF4440 domain-containing protein [Acidobacteriota bacterium]